MRNSALVHQLYLELVVICIIRPLHLFSWRYNMSLREAIESYHELLTDELAAASYHQLEEQQRRHGLFFGGRPLCSVLRPRFMTPEQYRFLQSRVNLLLRAFDKAYQAAVTDEGFRSQFGLLDWEVE